MEIKSISQKIFKTNSVNSENKSNHTNPFGVNFKGNMINADVFEPSFEGTKETLAQKAANKLSGVRNKLSDAMNVGSINSFISKKVDAVVDFGKRISEGVSKLWNEAKSYEVNLHIYDNLKQERNYSKVVLRENPTIHIESLLKKDLATPAVAA